MYSRIHNTFQDCLISGSDLNIQNVLSANESYRVFTVEA